MIYISETLQPTLRAQPFCAIDPAAHGLQSAPERERLYVITTLQCPCRCEFCLFIKTVDPSKECSDAYLAERVTQVLTAFPRINFSVSITGGEPLMHPHRITALLEAIRATTAPEMVRWIGFGASGTTKVPLYLNTFQDFHFDIYLSRHHYERAEQQRILQAPRMNPIDAYTKALGPHVDIRLSCNLLRQGIATHDDLRRYLDYAGSQGIQQVTFRELNKIHDATSMYRYDYIKDYVEYYDVDRVPLTEVLSPVERDPAFQFLSQDIRPFIYHERWQYGDVTATFRRVDEQQLVDYNASFAEIDEVVIHQDGLVTGCWDRQQKILEFA